MSHRDESQCDSCGISQPRRAFLKYIGAAGAAALMAAGMPASLAAMVTPEAVTARRREGSDPVYPVPASDGVQIDSVNEVILVRWKNSVYAFNLSCPHQNAALRWNAGDAQFQCPKHHSKYQPDGTYTSGRATRNMDRFSLHRTGEEIVVDVGHMHKSDADSGGWSAAVVAV